MIDCFYKPAPPPKTLRGKIKRWKNQLSLKWTRFLFWIGWKNWKKVPLPVVNKTFGPLNAKDICSVQPMTGETGLIAQMNIKYGKKK